MFTIMIYFKLYSLSTTYIYNLKIPKYSPKENIYIYPMPTKDLYFFKIHLE